MEEIVNKITEFSKIILESPQAPDIELLIWQYSSERTFI